MKPFGLEAVYFENGLKAYHSLILKVPFSIIRLLVINPPGASKYNPVEHQQN